jgi:hypothetical protein
MLRRHHDIRLVAWGANNRTVLPARTDVKAVCPEEHGTLLAITRLDRVTRRGQVSAVLTSDQSLLDHFACDRIGNLVDQA